MTREAEAIADEMVTETRLTRVMDRVFASFSEAYRRESGGLKVQHTGAVMHAMIEDVCREAGGEIADSKAARKAIGSKAASMFKRRLNEGIAR